VLAVGDVAFQKKCLGKMQDIASHGRTVLFVSHNMQAVRSLCTECIFLKNGQLIKEGATDEVLSLYNESLRTMEFSVDSDINNKRNRRGNGDVRFSKIVMEDEFGNDINTFQLRDKIIFKLKFTVYKDLPELYTSFALRSGKTREVVTTARHKLPFENLKQGEDYEFSLFVNANQLRPGEYPLYFWLGDKNIQAFDVVDDAIAPLIITTRQSFEELGFDPSVHSGFFSLSSSVNIS
jgi:lipopolysaccharide transport system ATP-binding protein